MQGILDYLVIVLAGLAAGLAVLIALGFALLSLGCLAALAVLLTHGRPGMAATQLPALVAMGAGIYACWRALRKEVSLIDSMAKGGEALPRSRKLKSVAVNLLAILLCGLVAVQTAAVFRRIMKAGPSYGLPVGL